MQIYLTDISFIYRFGKSRDGLLGRIECNIYSGPTTVALYRPYYHRIQM